MNLCAIPKFIHFLIAEINKKTRQKFAARSLFDKLHVFFNENITISLCFPLFLSGFLKNKLKTFPLAIARVCGFSHLSLENLTIFSFFISFQTCFFIKKLKKFLLARKWYYLVIFMDFLPFLIRTSTNFL